MKKGRHIYWTKENIQKVALKYKTRREFRLNNLVAYVSACKSKCLDDVCSHMLPIKQTKESIQKSALKYKTISEFLKADPAAYHTAYRNSWLSDVCSHMTLLRKPNGWWTKNNIKKEAKKYKTKKDFSENCSTGYTTARSNGWLFDVCKHMRGVKMPRGYWTKENLCTEALKYNTKSEFLRVNYLAYQIILKNNWLEDLCSHMVLDRKSADYWTKKNCKLEAKKYKTRSEFCEKSYSAYKKSLKNKWIDDVCSHMVKLYRGRKPKYTYDDCKAEALKYNYNSDFRINSGRYYSVIRRKGWFELISHLKRLNGVK